MKKGSCNQT